MFKAKLFCFFPEKAIANNVFYCYDKGEYERRCLILDRSYANDRI